MKEPLLSVVLSAYNGEKDLSRTIESVLSQSFKDFEFIVINDGSTDDTLAIITEQSRLDDRIKVIDQKNTGLTKARNKSLRRGPR